MVLDIRLPVGSEDKDERDWKGEYGGICIAGNVLFLIVSGDSTGMFPCANSLSYTCMNYVSSYMSYFNQSFVFKK